MKQKKTKNMWKSVRKCNIFSDEEFSYEMVFAETIYYIQRPLNRGHLGMDILDTPKSTLAGSMHINTPICT